MTLRDRLLGLSVAALWGCSFLAIEFALRHFPPLFCVGLRFAILALPTVLFVPRPRVKWKWLIGYGLGFGTGQFAFLFIAFEAGMPVGLASLVLQASAPLTVLLGALLLRERLSVIQLCGIGIAVLGMAIIGWHRAQQAALLPVLLTLCGALSWALGNLCSRKAEAPNPLHLTMWMSVVPPVPMFVLSALTEGSAWPLIGSAFGTPTGWLALAGLAYIVVLATVLGNGIWTTLMGRYPASTVAPFSMLVPVVGFSAAWLILGEQQNPVELAAAAVVVAGVLLGSLRSGRKADTAAEKGETPPAQAGGGGSADPTARQHR